MNRLFSKIIERNDVKDLISEIINNNRYKKVNIPLTIDNNYFFNDNYALFLFMDALLKFDIIIDNINYIEEYVSQLKRLFKRIDNYQDISKGINKIIASTCLKILNLNNYNSSENKEKILRYIYKKYIVDGYFYYGFSSCSKREIDFSGIKKSGFILDSRVDEMESILKKYENKDIIKKVDSDITDNFIIASYYAMSGPYYLERMANSSIFNKACYDKDAFYKKDINILIKNLEEYAKNKHMSIDDTNILVKNFYDILIEDNVNHSFGIVAFIKRSYLNKNYLKNIEEIVEGSKYLDISSSISMIMESRYSSYDIDDDISSIYLEFLEFPSYKYLCGEEKNVDDDVVVINLDEVSDSENSVIIKKKIVNSYGFISIFMILLLLITLISTTIIIMNFIWR